MFSQIEELIKVVKRLLLAAKCESGEDWVTICLLSSNQAVLMSRVCSFVSFSKRSLQTQKDISNVCVLILKVVKRIMQVGDDYRRVPDNAKYKLQFERAAEGFHPADSRPASEGARARRRRRFGRLHAGNFVGACQGLQECVQELVGLD
jgi:hypothetical protein